MRNEKELTAGGKKVKVTTEKHADRKYTATATVGSTTVSGRMTIGPANGAGNPNYSKAQMQKDVDDFRQRVADTAAFREKVKEFEKDID